MLRIADAAILLIIFRCARGKAHFFFVAAFAYFCRHDDMLIFFAMPLDFSFRHDIIDYDAVFFH